MRDLETYLTEESKKAAHLYQEGIEQYLATESKTSAHEYIDSLEHSLAVTIKQLARDYVGILEKNLVESAHNATTAYFDSYEQAIQAEQARQVAATNVELARINTAKIQLEQEYQSALGRISSYFATRLSEALRDINNWYREARHQAHKACWQGLASLCSMFVGNFAGTLLGPRLAAATSFRVGVSTATAITGSAVATATNATLTGNFRHLPQHLLTNAVLAGVAESAAIRISGNAPTQLMRQMRESAARTAINAIGNRGNIVENFVAGAATGAITERMLGSSRLANMLRTASPHIQTGIRVAISTATTSVITGRSREALNVGIGAGLAGAIQSRIGQAGSTTAIRVMESRAMQQRATELTQLRMPAKFKKFDTLSALENSAYVHHGQTGITAARNTQQRLATQLQSSSDVHTAMKDSRINPKVVYSTVHPTSSKIIGVQIRGPQMKGVMFKTQSGDLGVAMRYKVPGSNTVSTTYAKIPSGTKLGSSFMGRLLDSLNPIGTVYADETPIQATAAEQALRRHFTIDRPRIGDKEVSFTERTRLAGKFIARIEKQRHAPLTTMKRQELLAQVKFVKRETLSPQAVSGVKTKYAAVAKMPGVSTADVTYMPAPEPSHQPKSELSTMPPISGRETQARLEVLDMLHSYRRPGVLIGDMNDTAFLHEPTISEAFQSCGSGLIHDSTFLWLAGLSFTAVPIYKKWVPQIPPNKLFPEGIELTTKANGLGPVSSFTSLYHLTGSALRKYVLPKDVKPLIHNTTYKKIFGTQNLLGGIGRVIQVPLWSATAVYSASYMGTCMCDSVPSVAATYEQFKGNMEYCGEVEDFPKFNRP